MLIISGHAERSSLSHIGKLAFVLCMKVIQKGYASLAYTHVRVSSFIYLTMHRQLQVR
jgi:hypothetical protein